MHADVGIPYFDARKPIHVGVEMDESGNIFRVYTYYLDPFDREVKHGEMRTFKWLSSAEILDVYENGTLLTTTVRSSSLVEEREYKKDKQ